MSMQSIGFTFATSLVLHAGVALWLTPAIAYQLKQPQQQPIHVRFVTSNGNDQNHNSGLGKAEAALQLKSSTTQPTAKTPTKRKQSSALKLSTKTSEGLVIHSSQHQAPVSTTTAEPNSLPPTTANLSGGNGGQGPQLLRDSVEEPDYAPDALAAAFQGILVVEVTVAASGQVIEANLRNPSGFSIDHSVVQAARRARYHPARTDNGLPTAAKTRLSFNFRIPHLSH